MFSEFFLNMRYDIFVAFSERLPANNIALPNVADMLLVETLQDLLYGINYFFPLFHVAIILGISFSLEMFYILVRLKKALFV